MFSIIYVNFESEALIINSIKTFLRYNADYEHGFEILVSNNSDLKGLEKLIEKYPLVKVVQNLTNVGFGSANNVASRQAAGDYLVFVNPDVEFKSQVLTALHEYYRRSCARETDFVGVSLHDIDGKPSPSFKGFPTVASELKFLKKISKIPRKKIEPGIWEVDMISGAFLCVPAKSFSILGGFDKEFFLYYEEMDLQYRNSNLGGRSIMLEEVSLIHVESSITGRFPAAKQLWISTSRLLFHKKNSKWSLRTLVYAKIIFFHLASFLMGRGAHHIRILNRLIR